MTDQLTSETLRSLIPNDRVGTHWQGCSGRGHEWCEVARHADAMEKLEQRVEDLQQQVADQNELLDEAYIVPIAAQKDSDE